MSQHVKKVKTHQKIKQNDKNGTKKKKRKKQTNKNKTNESFFLKSPPKKIKNLKIRGRQYSNYLCFVFFFFFFVRFSLFSPFSFLSFFFPFFFHFFIFHFFLVFHFVVFHFFFHLFICFMFLIFFGRSCCLSLSFWWCSLPSLPLGGTAFPHLFCLAALLGLLILWVGLRFPSPFCVFPLLFAWCCLLFVLWMVLRFPISSVGWRCLVSSSFFWVVLLFFLLLVVVLSSFSSFGWGCFFPCPWSPPPPKGRKEGITTEQEREKQQLRP